MKAGFSHSEVHNALSIFNASPDYVCWKDTDLNYAMMNDASAKLFGFQSSSVSFNQINDHDLQCEAAALATKFQQDDQHILTSGDELTLFNFCKYDHDQWKLLFGKKSLILDESGNKKGVYARFMDVTKCPAFQFIIGICVSDQTRSQQLNYIVKDRIDDFQLTTRETQVIFYLIRGNTAKEIARKINLSFRTVEKHIDRIKKKMNVNTRSQLIEKALSLGLLSFLPSTVTDS